MIKNITIPILLFSVLFAAAASATVQDNSRNYPIPRSELEDIVNEWLSGAGFSVYHRTMEAGLIRMEAEKGSERWDILLRQNSPLATEVQAFYSRGENHDTAHIQALWNFLSGYHKGSDAAVEASNAAIPTPVLARIESVVCIHADLGDGDTIQFSGFIVDASGLILCTAHYLKGIRGMTLSLFDGLKLKGAIIKIDYERDLALINVNQEFHTFVSLADGIRLLGMGQKVYSVGCPENLGGTIYSGFINGPPRSVNDHFLWQVSMKVYPGSSGSPVFDAFGNLVAVVKARHKGTDSLGFLIPYETILSFVRDIKQ